MKKIKLTFAGGVGSVTGANFMWQSDDFTCLVDCGLLQGGEEAEKTNWQDFPYNPADVDVLLITHAHADHIGRIPKLVRDGFTGVIYSTGVTKELSRVMLADAQRLSARHGKKWGLGEMFSEQNVGQSFIQWETIDYHAPFEIGDGWMVNSKDAGHVLGSAIFEITHPDAEGKLVYTGDLGNTPAPLLRDTEDITGATYMISESVYGDRNHEHKEERTEKLKHAIKKTLERDGVVVIPAFSLERTQQMLYEINNFVEDGHIPSVPVYLDSPLAIKVTEIYDKHKGLFNQDRQEEMAEGDDLFDFPKLKFSVTRDESKMINRQKGPMIIIAGSGMSGGGRVVHHEKRYLEDHKNTVLLVGYQSVGTVGRQLLDGNKEVNIFGDKVRVRAEIVSVLGYSAHKQSDDIVDFIAHSADTLKKVFVCMGELKSSLFLAQRIHDYLDVKAEVPKLGSSVDIEI